MAIIHLRVLQERGKWTVELHDARGVQRLGATRSRGEIEAFSARLMADLVAQGDCPIVEVVEAAVATPPRAHEISSRQTRKGR